MTYVFSSTDARPADRRSFTDAMGNKGYGMDVSPAVRDCLGFTSSRGANDRLDNDVNWVNWQFVDDAQVPYGPWKQIVTTSQVYHP